MGTSGPGGLRAHHGTLESHSRYFGEIQPRVPATSALVAWENYETSYHQHQTFQLREIKEGRNRQLRAPAVLHRPTHRLGHWNAVRFSSFTSSGGERRLRPASPSRDNLSYFVSAAPGRVWVIIPPALSLSREADPVADLGAGQHPP